MLREVSLLSCLALFVAALAQVQSSTAQTVGAPLRGSVDDGTSSTLYGTQDEAATEAVQAAPADRNPTQAIIGLVNPLSNTATAEEGSDGLGAAGRVTPVRPFADRLAAVRRNQGSGVAGGIDDTVFDGETVFDAAEGLRVGTFTVIPQLTLTTGYTDNTSRSAGGQAGALYRIAPDITATSGWSRHQLDLALRGSYVGYPGSGDDDDPSGTASAALRLDVSHNTAINADLAYSYSREETSSAENISGDNDVHEINASLGATRSAGLVAVTLRGDVDQNIYSDPSSTSTVSGRDNALWSARLRLDANTGGSFEPFIEGSLIARRYDRACTDALCERRDSEGYELRVGTTILSGPKLTGDISAGWHVEDLEDNRLKDLAGLIVDGSLVWSPSRLTTVTAGIGTSFEATDIDGASGSVIYSGDIRASHAFSDRLVGELGGGFSYRTYKGASIEETTLTGRVEATYAVSKHAALRAGYAYRKFDSSGAGSDYSENRIEAGLRIRR